MPRVAVLGLVAVALVGAAPPSSTATAPPPPPGTRIYTYDVVLRYHVRNAGVVDRGGRGEQAWTRDYTWSATFRNFKFRVSSQPASGFIGVNAAGRTVRSTARVTERWEYFWHPDALSTPTADCEGRTTARVPVTLAVAIASPSTPNFSLRSQLPNGWDTTGRIQAVCNDQIPPRTRTRNFTLPDGTTVDGEIGTLVIDFERRSGGRRVPVGELAVGRSFRFSGSQTRRQPACEGDCSGTLKIEERYSATFTARR